MKKIILTLIILIFLYFVPNSVQGQNIFNINKMIPGAGCGVAGDETGKDICCNIPVVINCQVPLLDKLDFLPVVKNWVSDYEKKCKDLESFTKTTNDTACIIGEPSTVDFSNPGCRCVLADSPGPSESMIIMCKRYLTSSKELPNCISCANTNGMWTGMGCLPLDIKTLIGSFVLSTGIGLGGGLALLCIIYSAFMMQSSQGNPEKLKKAQEMITSCIMGLMLIIFSIFIMKIIGVNILRIPGFG